MAVTPEVLDHFYADLLRCRDHCRHPDHPEPQPPNPAEAAQILIAAWTDPDLGPLVR